MSDLQIYVPSRSRFDRSLTLEHIAPNWKGEIFLVVPRDQKDEYKPLAKKHGVKILATKADGTPAVRHWIGEHANNKFVMLDDDLRFSYRPKVNKEHGFDQTGKDVKGCRLYAIKGKQITRMLKLIEHYLDRYAHVSVSARTENIHHKMPIRENSRMLRVLAYCKREFLKCEHGRAFPEDFDTTLQLLAMGYKNAVITTHANDQASTNLPGGCSDYRTLEFHNKGVKHLHKLWPDFTRLVKKENKSASAIKNGLAERWELNIQWIKAWESSGKDRKPKRVD